MIDVSGLKRAGCFTVCCTTCSVVLNSDVAFRVGQSEKQCF